jgi:translocation and assembly module TamB
LGRDFDVELKLRHWPASDLEKVLGIPLELQGLLSGKGSFSSTGGDFRGAAMASVATGSFRGQDFDIASSQVSLREQTLLLDELSISRGPASLQGKFQLDIETHEVKSELRGRRVPLSALGLAPRQMRGELDGSIAIGGSLEEPSMDMEADASALMLGEAELGGGGIEAHLRDKTVSGAVSVAGAALNLQADARVRIAPGFPIEGRAQWSGADLAPVVRSIRGELPESLHLISSGEASFDGSLDSIETLSADGRLSALTVEVSGYRLTSSAPIDLRLRRETLEMSALELLGDDTRIRLAGKLGLGAEMDLKAGGSVNLKMLNTFFPSMTWSGGAELSARVEGTWDRPSLSGYVDLDQGALSFRAFPQAIGDIHGRVRFDNRTVRLQRIEGRFGGAPVALTGNLSLSELSPDSFELKGSGQGLRLRYPQGLVATVDADLSLTGTAERQILAGRVQVREATWTREYDVAAGILGTRDVIGLVEPAEERPFPDLRLDVSVVAPDSLRVRNSLATIDARAEFQLRGTFARPALLGRAEALRGEVFLLGQRYNILAAKVEFVDPSSIKPFFDLAAETRARSYQVQLRLAGTPDRFFPELSSDPPLRPVEILRLLAGATERELRTVGSEEEEVASVGVASLLTERLNQQLSRRAERLFGLDRISIDPSLVGQFANPVARVSVGKQISRDLAINYSTAFGETTESIVVVIEYTPKGPVSWIFSRDETGALAVDMKFRKSF